MAHLDTINVGDETYKTDEIHNEWLDRAKKAEKDRDQYLGQIRINRKFAAGKQHLDISNRDGRVIEVRYRDLGGRKTKMLTADQLGQYLLTAVGRMAGNDYQPNFLVSQENELAQDIAAQMNDAFGWGWDNEFNGDLAVLEIFGLLVVDGTAAVRCRYDRRFGEVLGEYPVKDGKPVEGEEGRKYMAESYEKGERPPMMTMRAGKVHWEIFSVENLLPPPGYENPEDFPWEIIVRPVDVDEVKKRYGKMADGVEEESLESSGSLTAGLGITEESPRLEGKCLVYTGYQRPNGEFPKGRTVVFTKTNLLDVHDRLPYDDHPKGPRSGMHYFRWQVLPGRFLGRAFIEGGIGSQIIFNKRLTQIDTIIDRNMPRSYVEQGSLAHPRTGEPMEEIEVRPGSPLPQIHPGVAPGQWMMQDIKLQQDNIEKALGMRSITLGQPPQGVSAYSAMALLTENDSLKLDPIAQRFRLEMVELAWDTMEAMRNWPKKKVIMIAGPSGALKAFEFNKNIIPERYLVRPPRGGSLPRSQAAELQKVNDIWNAASAIGQPLPLEWYVQSLDAGKPQQIPTSPTAADAHVAELENIVMFTTGEAPPVTEEQDDETHVKHHRPFQAQMKAMADQGDEHALEVYNLLEEHCVEHMHSAERNANVPLTPPDQVQQNAGPAEQPGPAGPVPGSPSAGRPELDNAMPPIPGLS